MKFDLERLTTKPFFISLGFVTIFYFAIIRVFQDWLYHLMHIDGRPLDMFASFGQKFSQAEPFEIILYLAGYIMIPLVAYLLAPIVHKVRIPRKVFVSLGIVFALIGGGVVLLRFPFDQLFTYIQTHTISHIFWFLATKRIIVTYLLLVISAVFFILHYIFSRSEVLRQTQDEKVGKWEKILKKLWPLGFVLLAFLIFNPSVPIDPHHYNYFVGSVHEIYEGKALLYESSNLYGLFNIYFLLALFKLIPLSFTVFATLIMAVYFLHFSILWLFIRRWLGSYTLATLATTVIVAITYFFQSGPSRSVLFLPAMSPFRWGLYVIALFLMLGFERSGKTKYLHGSLFVAAFSLFWNFDSGLFLSAATLLTVGYLKLHEVLGFHRHPELVSGSRNKQQTKKEFNSFGFLFSFLNSGSWLGMTVRKVIETIAEYVGYVFGLFAITSIINKIIYGSWPHWEWFFRESKYFSTGIAMYPLPKIGVFEILFFVYAVVFVFALVKLVRREQIDRVLLFLALYGAFSFIYYIGESSWQIMYVVVAPCVLITAYAYRQLQIGNIPIHYSRVIRSGFAALVFFGVMLLAFKLPLEFSQRNYCNIVQRFTSIDPRDQATMSDAEYLKANYPISRLPVMSLNDTKLMMYSGKVNAFDFYYIFTIYFRSEMQKYVDQVRREQPEYVIIGKDQYRNDQVGYFLNGILGQYSLKEFLQTVEIYQPKTDK